MAFDGAFLYKICEELNQAVDCHIDKIYQPSRDELVFLLRKKGFAKRLIVSARSGCARIHFTDEKYENPETPPMFCMLMRKHLSSARMTGVVQNGLERVVELLFSATNEMGDRVKLRLVCELIGNSANIILVGEDCRIIDCLKKSDIETATRLLHSGALYQYPQSLNKLSIITEDVDRLVSEINSKGDLPLWRAVLDTLEGISPLVARELEYRVNTCNEALKDQLTRLKNDLSSNHLPYMLKDSVTGKAEDFCYTEIKQYKGLRESLLGESFSGLLDQFYSEKQKNALITQACADIIKTVSSAKARIEKKRSLRLLELEKCKDREKNRIYGELIKANLYMIENGSLFAEVQNYYDEDLKTVKIPLNPAISPAANAAKYFKEYKKSYTAEQTLLKLTVEDEKEIEYLDSVMDSISRCESIADIREIREELVLSGYIKNRLKTQTKKHKNEQKFNEYISTEGYRIIVGKNNIQNDYITNRLASKNDLWFHVKNIAGSHVVVFSGGQEVSDETVLFAALLAAKNSKAAASSNVAVDYAPVKYVKKPNGAKPGMVIYTTNKTIFVTPEEKI